MQKKWKIQEKYPKDWAENFKEFGDLTLQIAYNRGLRDKGEVENFLNPDYEGLGNSLEIMGMEKAADRIIEAIEKKEKIIIYGDYDADGVCSSAILYEFLKTLGHENTEIYIPDLFKFGHGINQRAIEDIFEKNVDLVITIDNGVSDGEEVKKLEDGGVNVIVLDHHVVPEELPPATVLVDLWQKGEKYPFKDFSASGLAFKTVSAVLQKNRFGLPVGKEKWLLDLAAIGTVADMVSLTGENRILVYWGLEVLRKTRRIGLKYLAQKTGVDLPHTDSDDIAFYIAPRINVAGKFDHATLAGNLLLTESSEEADWLSGRLENLTAERKETTEKIVEKAKEVAEKSEEDILVLGSKDWPTGVLGGAASRVVGSFSKTAVLWGKGDAAEIKGSSRSAGDVNVRDLLIKAGKYMYLDFGGHPMAAGFTLKEEFLNKFEEKIKTAFEEMPKEKVAPDLVLEAELSADDINFKTYEIISRFEPFGQKNTKPNFLFKDIEISSVRTFGNGGIHLEMSFKNSKNKIIKAVGFFSANLLPELNQGDKIDLAGSIDLSRYRGKEELRLKITDFKHKSY